MTRILAIDPGSTQSAFLGFDGERPVVFGIVGNDDLLRRLRAGAFHVDVVAIEQIESFGMAVGREVFDTVRWSGRFEEAAHPIEVAQVTRRAVKLHLCGSAKAKDANIRQALLDRFGPDAKGTKASPGPLYGIAKDVWSALAIALTFADTAGR